MLTNSLHYDKRKITLDFVMAKVYNGIVTTGIFSERHYLLCKAIDA
jgi:hypothetical protein